MEPLDSVANKKRNYANVGAASHLRLGKETSDNTRVGAANPRAWRGGPGRGTAACRCRPLSGSDVPVGVEPGEGDSLQLDAQSISRLHARLPLLFRAAVPDAVRAWS